MSIEESLTRWIARSLLFTALFVGSAGAESVPAPAIHVQGNGSYLVTYDACSQCSGHGLQEYEPQTGSWAYVGSGDLLVSNRAPGSYRYRVVYFLYLGRGGYQPAFGPDVTVVVNADGRADLPARPSLSEQMTATWAVHSGHIDSDGNRDILIRRSTELPEGGDGTIGNVLLKQTTAGELVASIPGQWELSVAGNWPAADIELQARDVNIDGYLDLVLRDVDGANGFRQTENQILFAPGFAPSSLPPQVLAMDANLARFSRDIDRHLIDPEYYPENAPLHLAQVTFYTLNCGWMGYTGIYGEYGQWPGGCYIEPWHVYVVYRDYSVFHADAMDIASSDYGMIHGYESAETGMEKIAETIARVLGIGIGGWDINEILGEDQAVDGEADRQGMSLFAVLAAISEAVADEGEEESEASPPDSDRVLIKGRRVLGQGPFHTALEYRGSTVSAYDSDPRLLFDGDLVSEVNWPRDHPSLTLRMGFVDGPSSPLIYWSSILLADSRYGDDLPYDLFPSLGEGGYNSNSFVHGLVRATSGIPTIQLESFVGGERPVPASAFN